MPQSALEEIARSQRHDTPNIRGRIAWIPSAHGKVIGRFGWRATEPTVASQTAVAMAREMGLTNPLADHSDCGNWNVACRTAPSGGTPEVESELFDALVAFERWQSVPIVSAVDESAAGARLFASSGCDVCHRSSLRVELPRASLSGGASLWGGVGLSGAAGLLRGAGPTAATREAVRDAALIHPYTDLLLHDMGQGLADRNAQETVLAPSVWRTAPLWGMHAAYVSNQPVRLLHDGRARSIEEAVLWHDGEARHARDRYTRLTTEQRRTLADWLTGL